jgi:ABC-type antimicrobial peptide transport system permease subunit
MLARNLIVLAKASNIKDSITRTYKYNGASINYQDPSWDEVSVYFYNLDKVRDFAEYLRSKFNESGESRDNEVIEVDTNTITEKENFNFLSKVTGIISYLLVIFSILAISLFIFNLLKSHLSKVKMNIGTFKAIGLEDSKARGIYFIIIFRFIVFAALGSILLAAIIGYMINKVLISNLVVEKDIDYFRLFDLNTLIALLSILAASFIISWLTIKRMLNKTPGNLIYNR